MNNYNLNELPNENYKKLFEKFKEIETIETSKWNTNHILGYFVKKYKQQYNTDYKFKFNTPQPSKCFEIFQVKRLANFLSSDPNILKEYIDWIFQNKVVKAKRKLTSISFMTLESVVNEYKINFALNPNQAINRTTNIPSKYKNIFPNTLSHVNTYGDLAFIYQVPELVKENSTLFDQMKLLGFDFSILNKIV